MGTMSIVNEQMLKIEQFATKFNADVDPKHLTSAKIAFYSAMINIVEEKPVDDVQAQMIIVDRLYTLRSNALEILTDNIMETLDY